MSKNRHESRTLKNETRELIFRSNFVYVYICIFRGCHVFAHLYKNSREAPPFRG